MYVDVHILCVCIVGDGYTTFGGRTTMIYGCFSALGVVNIEIIEVWMNEAYPKYNGKFRKAGLSSNIIDVLKWQYQSLNLK